MDSRKTNYALAEIGLKSVVYDQWLVSDESGVVIYVSSALIPNNSQWTLTLACYRGNNVFGIMGVFSCIVVSLNPCNSHTNVQ